jgi:hypothetical protein
MFYLELSNMDGRGISAQEILPVTALNITLAVVACDKQDNDVICDAQNEKAVKGSQTKYPIIRWYKNKKGKGIAYTGKLEQRHLLDFIKKQQKKKRIRL